MIQGQPGSVCFLCSTQGNNNVNLIKTVKKDIKKTTQ